ncbi:MAG: carbohydrate deacetylase [Candidatus Rokuibacteriota bacterium]
MRLLIVNADDFGLTPGVSAGILSAHRQGIVTSTTALVNRATLPAQIDAALGSGIGIGLHINLTLGSPITRAPSLVDGSGRFMRDARQAAARASTAEIEAEIEAQLERFETLFRRPATHLDTHHHIGLLSPVREVVLAWAVRLQVPVRSQTVAARQAARSAGLATPDHFFGESGPDAYWTLSRTMAHLKRLPGGVTEFMTHPGYCDEELSYSRYGRQRETELVGLGAAARAAATALGIRLGDFRGLSVDPFRGSTG